MSGNVELPVVSKEEFRRILMFANSKRSDAVMGDRSPAFENLFEGVLPCELAGCVGALLQNETIECCNGNVIPKASAGACSL